MPHLHIVVLSGFNEFEYARQALRFGVYDYLLKPLDKVDLFEVLRKIEGKALNSDSPMVIDKQRANSGYPMIEQVKQIIYREYDISFEMEKMAERVGYPDPVYFNKLFKKIVGVTPKEFKNLPK